MKHVLPVCMVLLMSTLGASAQQAYIDLSSLFDADVFLQSGGSGLADPLDEDGRFLDAGTLPAGFAGGSPVVTQDGRAMFQFASLQQAGLDAARINGQSISIPEGNYASLDMAMLAAPGSFANPFAEIEFLYTDGTKDTSRLGPVAGWFASPVAFDNTFFRYTDDSQVETIVSIPTDFSPDDYYYLLQEQGNGDAGGSRFIDGTGFALYLIDGFGDVDTATLGVTVGNNFVVSIATEYWDPTVSTTEGYTVLANSMELYEGFEHRALGNLKQYTFDVSPFLAENTGELWILFTDATPSNGWGPYLQNITLFTGSSVTFETTLQVAVDASNAEVHAQFQTDGNDEEKKYLYDNNASGPSNRGHRYADGSGALTYRFDLPDDTTEASLAVDMANNFIVSLAGSSDVVRYHSVAVGSADENNYLVDAGGSNPGDNYRFADGEAYMIYQFDLPDDISTAFAQIHIGNQFVIEGAAGTSGAFEVEMDWVVDSGEETTDNSNLDYYTIDLSKYLSNNPGNIVRLRFSDGVPSNGWGPYLKSIIIVDQEETGNNDFEPVLNAMDLFGEDVHNEYNKGYYTIDLTPKLQNNAKNEVFVQFTDASPGDGWGPGVFWMAVYSGELDIQSDRLVFDDLKTTMGDPVAFGAGLLHRRYLLNPAKTLSGISLPEVEGDGDQVYLLAATLNGGEAPVSDWMLHE